MATRESSTCDLKVVLLGGRNSGKSEVGNVLLGREEFVIKERTTCSRRVGEVAGGWVTVVDTPGWWCDFKVQDTPQLVKREIVRSVSLCTPGPHIFLIVIKARSVFCEKRRRAVEEHLALLSERVWSHCMVVFTCSDWPGHMPMEQQVKRGGTAPLWLVEKCSHRYHCLNLKSGPGGNQVTELFRKMKRLVTENSCSYFKMEGLLLQEVEEKKRIVEQRAQQRLMKMQKQRSLLNVESCHLSDIRVVLLGARGSGKSSAGNTILGQGGSFEVSRRTAQCMMGAGDVAGRQVTVVDTPGWWMNYLSEDSPVFDRQEIVCSVSLCSPGPHALLLMMRVDRSFTETYRRAVQEHLELITDTVWAHIIILFNFGDWLGDTTIEQHIESEGEALQWLVEKCGNRYHVLNNRSNSGFQVTELMRKIEELMSCNNSCYCKIEGGVLQELEEKRREEQKRAGERLTRSQKQRETARSLLGELYCPSELRIMLLSGRNTGRSSAGNTILGREHFKVGCHATDCVEGQGKVRGKTVTVLDPPGWLSVGPGTLKSPSASGGTVVLVVVNVSSSFSHTVWRTAEKHLEALREKVWNRTMVLFTFGDWLGDTTIEQRIESEGEPLQRLVEKCGNRYHVLDSKSQGTGAQVTELLQKIEEMLVEERLEVLQRGEQVGKSLTVMQEPEVDGVMGEGIEVLAANHTACEVASSEDLLTPDDSGAPDFGGQELALSEASGGWGTGANHSILDVEGFLSSMASVLQGNQEGLMNLPDCLHTGSSQSHHMRWNGQNGRKPVTLFSPGHQALLLVIPMEQPKEPEEILVEKQEDIVDIQSLEHPRLRDRTLKEIARTGGLQALIDQWGNSNLEELESFIDSYFEMVWKKTMGSFIVEEEDCLTSNSPELDDVGEDLVNKGGQEVLSSIDKKLSKLDILEGMQRDLLELRQSLDHSCDIIQELSDKSKATQEPAVPSDAGEAEVEESC
uniref:Si:ch211-214j24.15 n=1 Tax=Hucho hucho TaxID=62062 RepID=A0A4W5Q9J4_9TELE